MNTSIRRVLLFGGCFELVIAIAHFLMPLEVLKDPAFASLPDAERDFLTLATVAVGLCMAAFGALCFLLRDQRWFQPPIALLYCISQGLVWAVRALLEVLLPVRVPLLSIANSSALILPAALAAAAVFLSPCRRWSTRGA